MRPGGSPIHCVAPRPEEIAQRFVCFSPNEIAIFYFVGSANELFELLLRQFILRLIRRRRARLRAPRRIGPAKLDPADFGSGGLALVDAGGSLIGRRGRAL